MAHPTDAELRALGSEILDLLVTQTIKEVESYYVAREATGTTNVEAVGRDGQIVPVQQVVEEYIRHNYSFLPDTFAAFAEPRPEEFDDAISQCVNAAMILDPKLDNIQQEGLGEIGAPGSIWPNPSYVSNAIATYPTSVWERLSDVKRRLGTWQGAAAREFNTQYLNEFDQALENQESVASVLAVTIEANKADIRVRGPRHS